MKERFWTGLAIFFITAVVLLTKIIIGTTIIVDVLLVLLALGASYEMSNILTALGKNHNKYLILAFPLALYGLFYLELALQFPIWLSLVLVLGLFLLFGIISLIIAFCSMKRIKSYMRENKIFSSLVGFTLKKYLNTILGFIYPSLALLLLMPLNHLAELNYLFNNSIENAQTISILMVALCFVVPLICDTFCYIVGKTFGGKKLAPVISPNKTISGAIGGTIFTVIIMLAIYLILNSIQSISTVFFTFGLSIWKIIIISFALSIMCQFGDLFESLLKRRSNMKNSGDILPGHGGLLDRYDGFIFVVPVVCIVTLLLILL